MAFKLEPVCVELFGADVPSTASIEPAATVSPPELGHIDANGMVKANGAAFVDANATGIFAYLSNTVSIYTDEVDKSGYGKVFAWECMYSEHAKISSSIKSLY